MTALLTPVTTRVFPFSIFDPVHVGIDEYGDQVNIQLAEKNILVGGEPGGGKSAALNLLVAHAALSADCRMVLFDGKQVELGPWRHCADVFVGPSIDNAITALRAEQAEMNKRYDMLLDLGLRKITRDTGYDARLIVLDEYAYFSATVGDKKQQGEFAALSRDMVARGRAAAMPVVLATQRPSHQVIDPSLRDLFAYRWAFRCTTDSSSDTVLGHGWAGQGYSAASIDPEARGVSWLLSETGVPRRIKTAYLTDLDIHDLAAYAASLRRKVTPHD
jgi:S-DNA-T family DNA segregation ATPase FtsK/SpoIIIE